MPLLVDKIKWEAVDIRALFYAMDVLLNLVPSEQMLRIWLCVLRAIDEGTVVQEDMSGTGLLSEFLNEVLQRVSFLTKTVAQCKSHCAARSFRTTTFKDPRSTPRRTWLPNTSTSSP